MGKTIFIIIIIILIILILILILIIIIIINVTCCRGALKKHRTLTALRHLQSASGFDAALREFLFEKVQKEVKEGAKELGAKDSMLRSVTRESVENFDSGKVFDLLIRTFPITGTVATAATARRGPGLSWKDMMKV